MVKNVLRKLYWHAKDFWSDLGFVRNQDVTVSGLGPEEKSFKASLVEECQKTLGKVRKELPEAKSVSIHVKSFNKGKGKRYELKASLLLPGGVLHASSTGRELYSALMAAFQELLSSARHLNSLKKNKHLDKD